MIITMLLFALASAFFAKAFSELAEKWKAQERWDYRLSKYLGAFCPLCFSFWVSVAFVVIVCIFGGYEAFYVFTVPFISIGIRAVFQE